MTTPLGNWMNTVFRKLLARKTWNRLKEERPNDVISNYEFVREFLKVRLDFVHLLKDVGWLSLGIFSAGFGLKGFLVPNDFIDGGVTGLSLLAAELTSFSLSVLIFTINVPFIILGYTQISKVFAFKSFLAISGLAVVIATVQYPLITSDKLLISVFGGFFLGAGIGLSIRGGGVLDGTEILAIFLGRKTGFTIGDIILILNIMIFSLAAYLLSVETALYSILTYLAASKTVDFFVEGIEEYTGVTIISHKFEEIRQMVVDKMGRGVTVYNGKKGYGKRGELEQTDIVYTVITRLEIGKLQAEIDKIDRNAFIVMNSLKVTKGGMIKKRPNSD